MIIKVCGMRNPDNIQQVSGIDNIDWMGFIFTDKSKRYVHAIEDFDTNTNKKKVGVFVDAPIEDIIEAIEKYKLDIIQLHGSETPNYIEKLKSKIEHRKWTISLMKAFAVDSHFDFSITGKYEENVDYFLFDAKGEAAGGNGIPFDWSVMYKYDGEVPFLLAGGINPESVDKINAFEHRKWIGIDVNSGFEVQPGLKKIKELQKFSDHISDLPKPTSIVRQFVKRFNKGDAEMLAALYHDEAVNHQVSNEPVIGKSAIRSMFENEFAQAQMTCIPENIFEAGAWAILEWRDPLGLRGCGFFKIEKGKIKLQRGYRDKLSFLKMHNLPIPTN